MKLSNKKIKYIKRRASDRTPEKIARDLRIRVRDVEKVLGISNRSFSHTPASIISIIFYWGLILISFLAPHLFMRNISDFANLPQMAFIQIGVTLLFVIWLTGGLISGNCMALKSPFHLPILAFLLWSLASLTYAHNRYEGFLPWLHWCASFLMFFLVTNGTSVKNDSIRFLTVLFISGCLTAILGIVQYLFQISWVPQAVPPAATFANKNMAAHFIILTFPLGLGFILNSRGRILPFILCILSALMIVFLVYTRTKAAWLALSVELIFFIGLLIREYLYAHDFKHWNRDKGMAAALALIIVLVMINIGPRGFEWGFGNLVDQAAIIIKDDESPEGKQSTYASRGLRTAIWRNTLEMIKDHPIIGFGLGNHKVFYPVYHRKAVAEKIFSEKAQLANVHNDYLQTFSELGVVGMLLLGWLLYAAIRVALSLTSPTRPTQIRLWTIGISVSVVGLLINACFSFPFQRSIPPFVLMILIAILGSFYAEEERNSYVIRRKWIMAIIWVIAIVVLIWLVRFHYFGIKSEHHYLNITNLEKLKKWEDVIYEGKLAYHYNPDRAIILSYMGRAYTELGRYHEGIKALEEMISAYPNHINALLNIGVAYSGIGEENRAMEVYRKIINIKPDYAKVHNNIANLHMKQNNFDGALEEFKMAVESDPQNSLIHFNIGLVEIKKQRYQKAAMAFENAIALKPGWGLAWKNLGVVCFYFLDRKEEGIRNLETALKLDPEIKDADQIRNLISQQEDKLPMGSHPEKP